MAERFWSAVISLVRPISAARAVPPSQARPGMICISEKESATNLVMKPEQAYARPALTTTRTGIFRPRSK
jgi:hypothetical protein